MNVFLLWHARPLADGEENAKLIGIYPSEAAAEAAQQRAVLLPGFRDWPDGFLVARYAVGEDNWESGFVTLDRTEDFFDETNPTLREPQRPRQVLTLSPDDLSLLRQMNDLFARAFDDPERYVAHPPTDAYLADLLGNPDFVAIAAVREGRVVGGLAGYFLPKFERDRKEFYLYDLAVDEGHRRQGIASQLIETLQGLAEQRGASVVFVQADRDDEAAIALYSRFGRAAEVLHFDINLSRPELPDPT